MTIETHRGDSAAAGAPALGASILREFFLAFIRVHILHHAVREPVYGLWFIEELRRHGYELSPGTLYPLLHSMYKAGYLLQEKRLVAGKIRKYYLATPLGRQILVEARAKIGELVAEVLDDEIGGPGRRRTVGLS